MNQASGWFRDGLVSVRKWWYKRIVLRDEDVFEFEDFPEKRWISEKKLKKLMKNDDGMDDFDYSYPEPDAYAYVW